MNGHQMFQAFDSHAAFYRQTYDHAVVGLRTMGTLGTSLIFAEQEAGDWSDAPTPDLVVCIARRDSPLTHPTIDLGAGRFQCNYRPGDFIVVAPNAGSAIQVDGWHSILCVALPYQRLRELAGGDDSELPGDGDFGPLHAGLLNDGEIERIATSLAQRADAGRPGSGLWADGAALQLASALLRLRGAQSAKPPTGRLAPWQLRRLTEHIMARLDQELSLVELASLLELTPYHVCRAFKRSTGLPPLRWQMQQRIDRSAELLRHTRLPVSEVAATVGYADPSAFAAAFKNIVGASPTEFRRGRSLP